MRHEGDMEKAIGFLATGFGAGRLPGPKGTYGTLVAIPLSLIFSQLPTIPYLLTIITMVFVAVWVSEQMVRITGNHDPQIVVIDEIVGYMIAMALIPHNIGFMVLAFVLFRICDIVKFWPIRWFEKNLTGGWGVVMDDVAAGVVVQLLLRGLIWYVTTV